MPKGKATFSSMCDQEQPCAAKVVRFIFHENLLHLLVFYGEYSHCILQNTYKSYTHISYIYF